MRASCAAARPVSAATSRSCSTQWAAAPEAQRHQWTLVRARPADVPAGWTSARSHGRRRRRHGVGAMGASARPGARTARRAVRAGVHRPAHRPAPVVLTIHDVSFFAHPEWFSLREGTRRRWLTAWSARRADGRAHRLGVLAAGDRPHLGFHRPRVTGDPPRHAGICRPRARHSGEDRANRSCSSSARCSSGAALTSLIDAFDAVGRSACRARASRSSARTAPGGLAWTCDALRRAVEHARSHSSALLCGRRANWPTLYGRASVFVFLSEYEGFGFTPLEALAAGVAPVLLDTPVARETYGAAARYVAPSGGRDAIAAALDEPAWSTQRRDRRASAARPACWPVTTGREPPRARSQPSRRAAVADNLASLAIIIVTYNSAPRSTQCLRVAGRPHRALPHHDHGGRQRLDRRHGRRWSAQRWPSVQVIDRRRQRRLLARQQPRHPRHQQRLRAAAQSRHRGAAGAIQTLVRGWPTPGRRHWRRAPVDERRASPSCRGVSRIGAVERVQAEDSSQGSITARSAALSARSTS